MTHAAKERNGTSLPPPSRILMSVASCLLCVAVALSLNNVRRSVQDRADRFSSAQRAILNAAVAAAKRENPGFTVAKKEYELSVRGKNLDRPYAYEVLFAFASGSRTREPTFPRTVLVVLSAPTLVPLSVSEEKERSLQDIIDDTIKVE